MNIQVQIVQGPATNQTFTFPANQRFVVGRGESADYQIEEDELLSREHFCLEYDGQNLSLTDLGSTNGTFVNGHALTHRPIILKNGQQFVAGRVSKFIVRFVGEPDRKADKKTTPSIAPPPASRQPQHSPPPSQPSNNFGSSIYQGGDQDVGTLPPEPKAGPAPPANSGGNFSQSIVSSYNDGPGT